MTNGNNGYYWFNLLIKAGALTDANKADPGLAIDQTSVIASADRFLKMIDFEKSYLGNDASKIFIGGSSFGCLNTLGVFVRYSGTQPLGGVMCFYGYTPIASSSYSNNISV